MDSVHADTPADLLVSTAGVAAVASALLQHDFDLKRMRVKEWNEVSNATQEQLTLRARQLMTLYVNGPAGEGQLRVAAGLLRHDVDHNLPDDSQEQYQLRAQRLVDCYKEASRVLPPWPVERAHDRRRASRERA